MSANTISGKFASGCLSFKCNKDFQNVEIKTPSRLKRIFIKTIQINVIDEGKLKRVSLRQRDMINLLESNKIEVSPYIAKLSLANLFCEFVNHSYEDTFSPQEPLCGTYSKGTIQLTIWKNDPSNKGIPVASLMQRLFRSTVKIKIWDEDKFHTFVVLRKKLLSESKEHGIEISPKVRNRNLIKALRIKAEKPDAKSDGSLPKSEKRKSNSTIQVTPSQDIATPSIHPSEDSITPSEAPQKGIVLPVNTVKEVNIQKRSALTYNKDGLVVEGDGFKTDHVILAGLKSTRFALKVYPELKLPQDPIRLEVDQKTMYIDGKELSDRYHLPLEEVLKQAKEGSLAGYLESKQDKLNLLEEIITHYDRLFQKYEKSDKKNLSSNVLMKIVRTAVKNKILDLDPVIRDKTGKNPFLQGKEYLPFFNQDKLQIIELTDAKKINSGAFGVIYKALNPVSGKEKVLKFGVPTFKMPGYTEEQNYKLAEKDLRNEKYIRDALHESDHQGTLTGIQKKSKGFTIVKTKIPGIIDKIPGSGVGVLAETLYDIDLFDLSVSKQQTTFPTFKEKIRAFYPVFQGFQYSIDKGLVHGDITPQNMLIRGKQIHIADFGGSHITEDKVRENKACTTVFCPIIDTQVMELLRADRSIEEIIKKHPEVEGFLEKNKHFPANKIMSLIYNSKDICALGFSLYLFLSEVSYPYALEDYKGDPAKYDPNSQDTYTHDGFLPKSAVFLRQPLINKNVPTEVIDLIEKMVKLNPCDRAEIKEILKVLKPYSSIN